MNALHEDTDYYGVLGVVPEADQEAIKAVYRALSKKFHPDGGYYPKKDAEARFHLLTEAYSTIGDPQRRNEYDRLRSNRAKQRLRLQAESVSNASDGFSPEENRAWKIVGDYYPEIVKEFEAIVNLSPALGIVFRVMLQETRGYADYDKLSAMLVESYLRAYFGENPEIQQFGKWCLSNGHSNAAIELNRTIAALGSYPPTTSVIHNITKKYSLEPDGYYISGPDREALQAAYSRMANISIWLIVACVIVGLFIILVLSSRL
jgi:curved DNA-binding protein CbpA